MAVDAARPADRRVTGERPVSAWHFVRLKLRVTANTFRGQGWRIALYVVGLLFGLWFGASGFLLLAVGGFTGEPEIALVAAAFGGTLLVLGWTFLPLVFFGVDETLDPARFALLPLRPRTLVTGMFAAALVGIPALAALIATSGIVAGSWALGGWSAGLVALVGILAGLLLCVAISRALTSAFAGMLRSRRIRDLTAVLLAVFAALLGPLQILVIRATEGADFEQFTRTATVLGWTPLAAPYTVGLDVVAGRAWAVPVKLLLTAVVIGLLLLWWSRSLESAMLSAGSSGPGPGRRGAGSGAAHGAVAALFPGVLGGIPRHRFGALVAREARYWWRDTRRRANLITFAVVGIFLPLMFNFGAQGFAEVDFPGAGSATVVASSTVFVGVLAASALANQFGFDGSAYAANVVSGVPGRLELWARAIGYSLYIGPLLVVISVVLALVLGRPEWLPLLLGTLAGAYGAGIAVTTFVSVLAPYSLPETSNPFAVNTGAGVTKSLLSLVGLIASFAVAIPLLVATALLGDIWLWLALPVGLAYGLGAVALGTYLAGDVLERRMPELLVAVTPRR